MICNDCKKRAGFNYSGEKAKYCKTHSLDGMVNVRSKRCIAENCDKQPIYNYKGLKKRLYCSEHKLEGMIDVISKRCITEDCDKIPYYNYKGEKQGLYCSKHKLEDMIDIKSKKCKLCNLTQPSLSGYCSPCFYFTFPEHVKTKNHKTRENAFMQPLKELYPDMILDKKINGGCSNRRPDGLIDLYTHCLVIEIDEGQHINYSCENKRTMEIFQDLGCRPVVYIRLNPDSYTTGDKKHKSAFITTKATGILSPVEKEFSKRFNTLLKEIEKQKKTIPEKTISTIQLYYSN